MDSNEAALSHDYKIWSNRLRSNNQLLCTFTTETQSQTKHEEYLALCAHGTSARLNIKRQMSIIHVIREGNELNHAMFIVKKASKLKFIKVCETLHIDVTKNTAPDKNSRARGKDRPKLF